MAQTGPIPVYLFGGTVAVGEQVARLLKPEAEVVHFATIPHAQDALKALVADPPKEPPEAGKHTSVASFNYSAPGQALVFGGGFTPEHLEGLRKGIVGQAGFRPLPWLGVDPDEFQKAMAKYGEDRAAYAAATALRVKHVLQNLAKEGKLGKDDGLYLY